jgi:uncharacterized membrane protein YfcA
MPDLGSLTALHLAVAIAVMALAGVVHGALGLGFPLVATPLLALITDIKTAIVFTLLPALTATGISVVKGGRPMQVIRQYWMLPVYLIFGSYLGARLLIAANPTPFLLLLALLVLAYLNLRRLEGLAAHWIRVHPGAARLAFGVTAGLFESTANVSGPVLLIFFLSTTLPPLALVQALNLCFLAGKTTQGLTLALAGAVPARAWLATLPFAAVGAAGVLAGIRVRSRIDAETYRDWLRRALWVIAVLLVFQFARRAAAS